MEDAWIHQIERVKTHKSVTARLCVGAFSQKGRTRAKPEKLDTRVVKKLREAQKEAILTERQDEWEQAKKEALEEGRSEMERRRAVTKMVDVASCGTESWFA